MKKLIIALIVASGLAGCATFKNPITVNRLAAIESSYGIALSASVAYRDACNKRIIAWTTCKPVVVQMRTYDKTAQGALVAARTAVNAGNDLDAVGALVAAQNALSAYQTYQIQNGVH